MHRVEALADRPAGGKPARTHPLRQPDPAAGDSGRGARRRAGSQARSSAEYFTLLDALGPELAILQDAPLEEIAAAGGDRLAEGIGRMRRGEVLAQAGYDGEYGVIKTLAEDTDGEGAGRALPGRERSRRSQHRAGREVNQAMAANDWRLRARDGEARSRPV